MLRLQTLGALALERDGLPLDDSAPRRRLLALLAVVAGHGPHGLTRDKLHAYLWPESDTPRARNSLKQALFSLRQLLGPEALVSSGDIVRLDRAGIQVDLWEFEAALDRGHAAEAIALYGGPFLDGFFVAGLSELEVWVEGERRRLSRRRTDALQRLAERAAAGGDIPGSVHWWHLVAAAEPLSSGGALGLMRALIAGGDRAGALEHGRFYERTLATELGMSVDDDVQELIERLRRPPSRVPAVAPQAVTPQMEIGPQVHIPSRSAALAVSGQDVPHPEHFVGLRHRSTANVVLPLLLAASLAGAHLLRTDRALGSLPEKPARLTVLPFETLGDRDTGELGRGLDALLTSGMAGLEGYRLVPPIAERSGRPDGAPPTPSAASAMARRAGARLYLTGRLIVDQSGLRAIAVLRDRANAEQEVGRAEAEVGRGELFTLADQLVRGLVEDLYGAPGQEMSRAAATATRSLPALKAYLEGERALRDEDYPSARDAFQRAVRADTAFALAYYRCSVAAARAGQDEEAGWAAALAARFSERLSEHDRRLVTAYLAERRGSLDEAERLYRGILADYPEDTEAWLQLGELLLHGNPLRGRSAREARGAFERVLELDSAQGDARVHLARVAALDGRRGEVDSLLHRAAADTAEVAALDLRAARAFALTDRPGRERATRDLLAEPSLVPRRLALDVAVHLDNLAGSERFASILAAARGTCDVPALGHRMLAQVAAARGQLLVARRQLGQADACDPAAAIELWALMTAQPFLNPPDSDLAELRRRLDPAVLPGMNPPTRSYYAALVAIKLGDTLSAANAARALLETHDTLAASELARSMGHSVRARIQLAAHRPAAALVELQEARWEKTAGLSAAEASDRFLRAELLYELGRADEAIGWYASIAERASYELMYLAPAELRLGRIYDARGNGPAALEHYQRFVELWRGADLELHPAVAEAQRRVAGLTRGILGGEPSH
jgi:DNA-binding SARP family transcriptional activator/tetratricopeptide (TPR) repeat protein